MTDVCYQTNNRKGNFCSSEEVCVFARRSAGKTGSVCSVRRSTGGTGSVLKLFYINTMMWLPQSEPILLSELL